MKFIHLFINIACTWGNGLKRIDEDRKINYCFEIQNFEKIPKIKETFKNIFCPEFIEKIFCSLI